MTLPLEGGEILTAQAICTPGLWTVLNTGDDWRSVARMIALNAVLRAELHRVAPNLERRAAPAPAAAIMAKLVAAAPGFGLDLTPDQHPVLFDPYLAVLAGVPLEALADAFDRWRACEAYPKTPMRHTVMPKPDELLTLAQPRRLELSKVAYRARKALEAPRVEARERGRPSEDDKARVAAMLAEVKAGVRGVPANPLGATPAERRDMFAGRRRDPGDIEEAV